MRIAHLSAEVSPYAKTGGLGDVVGALPQTMAELGHDVTVWMPYYRQAREFLQKQGISVVQASEPLQLDVGHARFEVGLLRTELGSSQVPLYLIAQNELFDRPEIYSPDLFGRDDGLIRYAVFVRAVLEAMQRLECVPDVLHAHDWHAALAPMALRWDAPRDWHFEKTATVLTIHNAAYQGLYSPSEFLSLGLPEAAFSEAGVKWRGAINLLKGGILAADAITAVSPTFAREIATPEGGFGLDPILRHRARSLVGIVNGIDSKVWNPTIDSKIPRPYDREHFEGKRENRRALLARAGMDPDTRGFVIGIVGRLVGQKGYDLLFPVLDELLEDGIHFVLLGAGEDALESNVRTFSSTRAGRFWGKVGFDDELAHWIEAGADTFLMPSRFEPCGLNQLYSLAYGTPPIVRRVGGLADTVIPYDGQNADVATGFGFDAPEPSALKETVRRAHRAFENPELWARLMKNGMAQDFSWQRSATKYVAVYDRLRR